MSLADRIERWVEVRPGVQAWLARVGRIDDDAPREASVRFSFVPNPRGRVILPPRLCAFRALFRRKHPGHARCGRACDDRAHASERARLRHG